MAIHAGKKSAHFTSWKPAEDLINLLFRSLKQTQRGSKTWASPTTHQRKPKENKDWLKVLLSTQKTFHFIFISTLADINPLTFRMNKIIFRINTIILFCYKINRNSQYYLVKTGNDFPSSPPGIDPVSISWSPLLTKGVKGCQNSTLNRRATDECGKAEKGKLELLGFPLPHLCCWGCWQ